MSLETDHGHYQEFKRTPMEEKIVQQGKRISELEKTVDKLQKVVKDLQVQIYFK